MCACMCACVFLPARQCQWPMQVCDTEALALIDPSRLGCDRERSPAKTLSACDLNSNGAAWLGAAPTDTHGKEKREAACLKYNSVQMYCRGWSGNSNPCTLLPSE